jgi:hypothetical protein
MSQEVTLTRAEFAHAALVGLFRRVSSLSAKRQDRHGVQGTWDMDIEGACGECALAKARNMYWGATPFSKRDSGDVARYEVRTAPQPDHCLIIRPSDHDERYYILLTGTAPTFTIRGWILGAHAKRPEWQKEPNGRPPAYFVPQDALHPIGELGAFEEEGAFAWS